MSDYMPNIFDILDMLLKKLIKLYPDDWEGLAADISKEANYFVTAEQCKTRAKELNLIPPAKKRIPIDELDYSANVRQRLGLSFYVETKKELFYASCTYVNKNFECQDSSNCLIRKNKRYILCQNARFLCANPNNCPKNGLPITSRDRFDIDHIISFKKHWDSLSSVNTDDLKNWYNDIDNLQIMCPTCNRRLGAKK